MSEREIKFRAWNGSQMFNDVWLVDGQPYDSSDGYFELFSDRCIDYGDPKFPQPFPIMQFTGLKDKHGAEIYEGDILANNPLPEFNKEDGFRVVKVTFEDACFWGSYPDRNIIISLHSMIKTWSLLGGAAEVVGNIHESPELLK